MKRVRVLVVFEEVDQNGQLIVGPRPRNTKFGSVTTEHYGSPERIALKVGELVTETISQHFPVFLEAR